MILVQLFWGLYVSAGVLATQEVLKSTVSGEYAVGEINQLLVQNALDPWELKFRKLVAHYEDNFRYKELSEPREIKLRKILELIIRLGSIDMETGCTPENLETIRHNELFARLHSAKAEQNDFKHLIAHYADMYDQACLAKFNRDYETVCRRIKPEDLEHVMFVGAKIMDAAPKKSDQTPVSIDLSHIDTYVLSARSELLSLYGGAKLKLACRTYLQQTGGVFTELNDYLKEKGRFWRGEKARDLRTGWLNAEICTQIGKSADNN